MDLAVQAIRYWVTDDGMPMISYAIRNRGKTPSTSFDVTLLVNGQETSAHEGHPRGLAPGKAWRWAFELGLVEPTEDELELGVRVDTAASLGPSGDSYVDHCPENNHRELRVRPFPSTDEIRSSPQSPQHSADLQEQPRVL